MKELFTNKHWFLKGRARRYFALLLVALVSLTTTETFAQNQKEIKGTVVNDSGLPLVGVTVRASDNSSGSITNIEGDFIIKVAANVTELVASYIGYSTKTIQLTNNDNDIEITLDLDATGLDEVVVVGYGTQKKKDLTGAVSQINAEKFTNESTSNISDVLRGSVPGLRVGYSSGPKGISSASSFNVRGDTNLRGSAANAPLIVLDGIIYNGDLADINPQDIEQIDVLKDASSAAIYGSRASNGVVIVTTKRGKVGKPVINLSSSIGMVRLSGEEISPLSPQGFIDWRIAGFESAQRRQIGNPGYYDDPNNLPSGVSVDAWKAYDGSSANNDLESIWLNRIGFNPLEIDNYKAGNLVDWESYIFQNGLRSDNDISISGRTDDLNYYWSLGYVNNEGHVYNDSWEAIQSRFNFDADIKDFLTVGMNLQYASKDESPYSALNTLNDNSPFASFYEDDGVTIREVPTGSGSTINLHPYRNIFYNSRLVTRNSFTTKLFAKVDLPFDISFTSEYIPRIAWDKSYSQRSSALPSSNDGGVASRSNSNSYEWQLNNILKWNKDFGNHRFDVTLLQNAEKYQAWSDVVTRNQFLPSDVLGYNNIGAATNDVNIDSNDVYETGTALMARLNYTLNEKYLFTGSVRRDGYSAFGQKNPTADFGSLAFGWILSDEDFFSSEAFDLLKFRLSYGTNGNRSIGRYSALSDLSSGNYVQVVNGQPTYVSQLFSNRLANADLKWEKTGAYNFGIDYSLIDGRISGNIETYYMQTDDLLVARSLPNITGYNSVTTNLGQVDNRGFEFGISTVNIDKKDFSWSTDFSLAYNKNEIVHLYGDMEDVLDDSGNVIGQKEADDVGNGWFIGHAVDEIWNYNVQGIWQEDEREAAAVYGRSPGDFKLEDRNGDGVYSNDDKIFQGNTTPPSQLTLRNGFKYKRWDFSAKMYAYLGHKASNNHRKNDDVFYDRNSGYEVPYWTPENPSNEWARIESLSSGFSVYESNSFARLDNLALTYNLSPDFINKLNIDQMKVSFVAQNPAVWSSWRWMDPEQKGYTSSFYTFKMNLTF